MIHYFRLKLITAALTSRLLHTCMAMNLQKIYQDTPGKKFVTHLNSAGSSLVPQCVLDAQINYLKEESCLGGYEVAAKYETQLQSVYEAVAKLVNCYSSEIAILESATVSDE